MSKILLCVGHFVLLVLGWFVLFSNSENKLATFLGGACLILEKALLDVYRIG